MPWEVPSEPDPVVLERSTPRRIGIPVELREQVDPIDSPTLEEQCVPFTSLDRRLESRRIRFDHTCEMPNLFRIGWRWLGHHCQGNQQTA